MHPAERADNYELIFSPFQTKLFSTNAEVIVPDSELRIAMRRHPVEQEVEGMSPCFEPVAHSLLDYSSCHIRAFYCIVL